MAIKINVGGNWKDVKNVWVNVNGTWKQKNKLKLNVNGSWKDLISYGIKARFLTSKTSLVDSYYKIIYTCYDYNLNKLWEKTFNLGSNFEVASREMNNEIFADKKGNFVVYSTNSKYLEEWNFIRAFDINGNVLNFSDLDIRGDGKSFCYDSEGNLYKYSWNKSSSSTSAFVKKYDKSGNLLKSTYLSTFDYAPVYFSVTYDGTCICLTDSQGKFIVDKNGKASSINFQSNYIREIFFIEKYIAVIRSSDHTLAKVKFSEDYKTISIIKTIDLSTSWTTNIKYCNNLIYFYDDIGYTNGFINANTNDNSEYYTYKIKNDNFIKTNIQMPTLHSNLPDFHLGEYDDKVIGEI